MCDSVNNWLAFESFYFQFEARFVEMTKADDNISQKGWKQGAAVTSQWTANMNHSNQLPTNQASVKLKIVNFQKPPFLE